MSDLNLGMSGCKIEKTSDYTIRKYSKDLTYNSRLIQQINKQNEFYNFVLPNIYTPKIRHTSKTNLFYFDMDYCLGKNYNQFLSSCSVLELIQFSDILLNYLDFIDRHSFSCDTIESKKNIINKLENLKNTSFYKTLIEKIIDNINLFEFDKIKTSFCHGDLTLANMLFDDHKVCFIDFLDSYIESLLIDIAKLKQDLFYFWILKKENILDTRLEQSFIFLWEKVYKKFSSIIDTNIFDLIDLINLLRIEPYVNDQNKIILIKCIESHKFYVNFNNSHGRTIF